MYLHGFEKLIFPDHSMWSSLGERNEQEKVKTIGQFVSADYLQPIKRLIKSTELFLVLTEWAWLCIAHCTMQSAVMIFIYSVKCILDCLPVSVITETVYTDDQ